MNTKRLSFWEIWNMSFGFLGIQFGFALQGGNMSRIFQTLGASMASGICCQTGVYPLDTIRRRQQMAAFFDPFDDGADELPPYKGAWRTLVTIVEDEGVLALFKGFSMNVVRTISGALILVGYDQIKTLL